MRLIRASVFLGERVRQIRVEQQVTILPLQQKSALPQPPEVEVIRAQRRGLYVGEQSVVLKYRFDHERTELCAEIGTASGNESASLKREAKGWHASRSQTPTSRFPSRRS